MQLASDAGPGKDLGLIRLALIMTRARDIHESCV